MTEVVATEDNEIPSHGTAWRDGGEGYDLLQSRIYTGNITKLYQAMALRHAFPILETRLDADDGLHGQYLQYVQSVAYKRFFYKIRRKPENKNDRRRLQEKNIEDRQKKAEGEKASDAGDDDEGDDGVDDGDDGAYADESQDEDNVGISPKSISSTNVKWLYWCARRHMEWHINVNQTDTKNKSATRTDALAHKHDKYPMGILNPVVS